MDSLYIHSLCFLHVNVVSDGLCNLSGPSFTTSSVPYCDSSSQDAYSPQNASSIQAPQNNLCIQFWLLSHCFEVIFRKLTIAQAGVEHLCAVVPQTFVPAHNIFPLFPHVCFHVIIPGIRFLGFVSLYVVHKDTCRSSWFFFE